jgi:hypothetical protein
MGYLSEDQSSPSILWRFVERSSLDEVGVLWQPRKTSMSECQEVWWWGDEEVTDCQQEHIKVENETVH